MNTIAQSRKIILLPALIGAALTYGALTLMGDDAPPREQTVALENRILELELSLAKKERELAGVRSFVFGFESPSTADSAGNPAPVSNSNKNSHVELDNNAQAMQEAVADNDQKVKALSTTSDRDPRSFSDKVNDLLALEPSEENIAIASKSVFDLAENRESLPDRALENLYQQQTNPDLKRVIAQVMSTRGDNSLIEKQIGDAQTDLKNTNPAVRQKALVELAKTHHASAANAIAPLLQDSDIGVKLDALLALRATGNQSHIRLVETLVDHPDPSVSWLANDVISNLQNLSDKARTRIASADIVAELPVLVAP